jgi:hypothetical protein
LFLEGGRPWPPGNLAGTEAGAVEKFIMIGVCNAHVPWADLELKGPPEVGDCPKSTVKNSVMFTTGPINAEK